MMFESDAYSIDWPEGPQLAVLRGVMRLPSTVAFDEALATVHARISDGRSLTIDLSAVSFMNSSGIRSLAGLVLRARESGARLRVIGSTKVPWQKKTIASLHALDPAIASELR